MGMASFSFSPLKRKDIMDSPTLGACINVDKGRFIYGIVL
jgi:hypothetical protein